MAVTARPDQPDQPVPTVRRGPVSRIVTRIADAIGTAEARAWGTDTPRAQER